MQLPGVQDHPAGQPVTVGSYVEGYVLHDDEEDEFYIEALGFSDEEEWLEQEALYA